MTPNDNQWVLDAEQARLDGRCRAAHLVRLRLEQRERDLALLRKRDRHEHVFDLAFGRFFPVTVAVVGVLYAVVVFFLSK